MLLNNFTDLRINPFLSYVLTISFLCNLIPLKRQENAFIGFIRGDLKLFRCKIWKRRRFIGIFLFSNARHSKSNWIIFLRFFLNQCTYSFSSEPCWKKNLENCLAGNFSFILQSTSAPVFLKILCKYPILKFKARRLPFSFNNVCVLCSLHLTSYFQLNKVCKHSIPMYVLNKQPSFEFKMMVPTTINAGVRTLPFFTNQPPYSP